MERSLEHSLVSPSYVFAVVQLTSNGLWLRLRHAQVHNNYNHQLWLTCKKWLKIFNNVVTAVQKLSLGTYILLAMYVLYIRRYMHMYLHT